MVDPYGQDLVQDEVKRWISEGVFRPKDETLPQFWFRQLQTKSNYRLARIALDMLLISAILSDCKRVFSQAKLLITG